MIDEGSIERRFLGVVEVDSGTLLLGDPLYCLPETGGGRSGIDYAAVLAAADEPAAPLDGRPVLLLGRFGGDGTYPVFAEFEDGELVRVTVEFIDRTRSLGTPRERFASARTPRRRSAATIWFSDP